MDAQGGSKSAKQRRKLTMDQGFSFSTLVSGVEGGGGGGWWGTADITRRWVAGTEWLPLTHSHQYSHCSCSVIQIPPSWRGGEMEERMQPPSHFASPLHECIIKIVFLFWPPRILFSNNSAETFNLALHQHSQIFVCVLHTVQKSSKLSCPTSLTARQALIGVHRCPAAC